MPRNNFASFPFYVVLTIGGRKRRLRVASETDNPIIDIEIFQMSPNGYHERTMVLTAMKQTYPDGAASTKVDVKDQNLNTKFRSARIFKYAVGQV